MSEIKTFSPKLYDYICPFCAAEIIDDYCQDYDEDEEYVVECSNCGNIFVVSYFYEPIFTVSRPTELLVCTLGVPCIHWSEDKQCCRFLPNDRNRGIVVVPKDNCPLGYEVSPENIAITSNGKVVRAQLL